MRKTDLMRLFTKGEKLLWLGSMLCLVISFVLFDRVNYLTLAASLIGVSSLIFAAKAHPLGQVLMILFSLIYGYISYRFSYYGEMITYLGMTLPMAVLSLVSWLRNPFDGEAAEVRVNRVRGPEYLFLCVLSAVVTIAFYYVLRAFHTANLLPSTISVTTSFFAAYLTYRRSPYFALSYAANDVVLLVLWTLATLEDISYLSVDICFALFLINDLYGFYNWRRIQARQSALLEAEEVESLLSAGDPLLRGDEKAADHAVRLLTGRETGDSGQTASE